MHILYEFTVTNSNKGSQKNILPSVLNIPRSYDINQKNKSLSHTCIGELSKTTRSVLLYLYSLPSRLESFFFSRSPWCPGHVRPETFYLVSVLGFNQVRRIWNFDEEPIMHAVGDASPSNLTLLTNLFDVSLP